MYYDHAKFNKAPFDRKASDSFLLDPTTEINAIRFYSLVGSELDVIFYNPQDISNNEGHLATDIVLVLDLSIDLYGDADISVSVGDAIESFIDLVGISLLPGETITIDTDLMIILFGQTHDVTSITVNSEFFNFGPGQNELGFEYDYVSTPVPESDKELYIRMIWENRWL